MSLNYKNYETGKEKQSICSMSACWCKKADCRDCNYQSVVRYAQECGECITTKKANTIGE